MDRQTDAEVTGGDGQASNRCEFSVIIPALKEAERIDSVVKHVFERQGDARCEIIVVDGDPDGETINAVRCHDVVTVVSQMGRARQMNAGANLAGGEILLFLHADTRLPPRAFEKARLALADGRYVAGAFELGVDTENRLVRATAAKSRLRARLTRTPYGDQAIFIRKSYFDKIAGFKDICFLEDIELMQRIKRRGDKIVILPDRVKTSARRWEKEGILYTTLRNMVVVTLYKFGVSPERLARYYRNHCDKA